MYVKPYIDRSLVRRLVWSRIHVNAALKMNLKPITNFFEYEEKLRILPRSLFFENIPYSRSKADWEYGQQCDDSDSTVLLGYLNGSMFSFGRIMRHLSYIQRILNELSTCRFRFSWWHDVFAFRWLNVGFHMATSAF